MSVYASEDEVLKVLDVLALSTDAMFAINHRHRIVFWNKPLTRLLGYSYDDVVGRTCGGVLAGTDTFGNRYCSDECPIIAMTSRGDAVRQFRLRARTKSGDKMVLDVSVMKFVMRAGGGVLLAHVVRPAEVVAEEAPAMPSDSRLEGLTAREIVVLRLLATGEKTLAIAEHLGIAPLTARNHISHMFEKLAVHSKAEAVALAYQMHVV